MQRNLAKVLALVMAASMLTEVPALTAYAEETGTVSEAVTVKEVTTVPAQDQKTTGQTEGEQTEKETLSETEIEKDGSTEMAGAGISVILSEYYSKNKDSKDKILKLLEPEKETETTKAEKETTEKETTKKEEETTKEKEPEQHEQYFKNLAIAAVGDYTYVNVRAKAGTDAEIVGKIYGNGGATILDQKNGWYHVKSGSIEGYVSSDYFITGTEAEKYALEMGYVLASVDVPALNLRKGKSTETDIVGSLVMGSTYVVLEISNGWAKLAADETEIGWVSMDYGTVRAALETAVAPNEEPDSEEPETTEAATQQPATTQKPTQQTTTQKPAAQTQNSTAASSKASEIIAYAKQFLGNPYVYGGSSLTNGTDCSGFTMSIYGHFGYSLNRSSRDQVHNGRAVSLDALQPGDLVFYAYGGVIGHVAIYIGNGQIIHASSPSTGIMISKLNYGTAPCAARRILS